MTEASGPAADPVLLGDACAAITAYLHREFGTRTDIDLTTPIADLGVDSIVVLVERLHVLDVRRANLADRGNAEREQVAVGLRRVALEIAGEGAVAQRVRFQPGERREHDLRALQHVRLGPIFPLSRFREQRTRLALLGARFREATRRRCHSRCRR